MITKSGKGVFGGIAFGYIKIVNDKEDVKRYFMKAVNEKKLKTSEINNLVKTSSTVVIGTVEKIKNPFDDMIKNG